MQREVSCPSGLKGTIRGLKGREMKMLSDKRKARSGEMFDEILAACWLSTTEPGPYTLRADGTLDWLQVLSGDRFYVLFQLREATYPDEPYAFRVQCLAPLCGESFEWELHLNDLPTRQLSPESQERFRAGNRFETETGGKRIVFQLGTGQLEREGTRLSRGASVDLVRVLATRIVEVEGVDKGGVVDWLNDLELSEHRDLLDIFDEADCGVETEIEVECPHCGNRQWVDLPFGPGFLMPTRTQRKSRRTARNR